MKKLYKELRVLYDKIKSMISKIEKHVKMQIAYQKERRYIIQMDQSMKAAEREISRLKIAFKILRNAGFGLPASNQESSEDEEEEKKG